jgi:molybdopterin/thiamine biosynthesis adenylyltransferase
MEAPTESLLVEVRESRYHRQSLIEWWDQTRVRDARVLVIGAGALGNEIAKNLALLGCGATVFFDPDRIERSNLSRAILFRESDEGSAKADVVARRMSEINPDARTLAICENALTHAGLGLFAWADVVIGAVDNREARVFINSACARTRKVWIDGAIEGFAGVVRAFAPWRGACYECTMNRTDRKLLAERRSCALLARDVVARGHVPTTAVAASIIGAMEVQEAIKVLHGQPTLEGAGLHLEGLFGEASRVSYPRRDDCPGHDDLGAPDDLVRLGLGTADITLGALLVRAERELGEGAVLDLSRDVITRLTCPSCGHQSHGGRALGALRQSQAACPDCGTHRVVEIAASVDRGFGGDDDRAIDLSLTPAQLGLPAFDIIVARQGLERRVAWLFDGDAARVLGPLGISASAAASSAPERS